MVLRLKTYFKETDNSTILWSSVTLLSIVIFFFFAYCLFFVIQLGLNLLTIVSLDKIVDDGKKPLWVYLSFAGIILLIYEEIVVKLWKYSEIKIRVINNKVNKL